MKWSYDVEVKYRTLYTRLLSYFASIVAAFVEYDVLPLLAAIGSRNDFPFAFELSRT